VAEDRAGETERARSAREPFFRRLKLGSHIAIILFGRENYIVENTGASKQMKERGELRRGWGPCLDVAGGCWDYGDCPLAEAFRIGSADNLAGRASSRTRVRSYGR